MVTRTLCYWKLLCAVFLALFCNVAMAESFASNVDRTTISQNETLLLTVTYGGQAFFSDPDFSSLDNDFTVLSSSRQQSLRTVNGATESATQWLLTLEPKRSGTLLIPSFSFKGDISDALEITVTPPRASQSGDPIFTESELSEGEVYIQQQQILTVRLLYSVPMADFQLTPPAPPNTEAIQIANTVFQKRIGATIYDVIEVRYALFSNSAGKIEIPSLQFSGRTGGSRFSRGQFVRIGTPAQSYDVLPRPDQIPLQDWLPSAGVKLSEQWSESERTISVGDSITRTVTLLAQNSQGNQLPQLTTGDGSGYKVYPDQAQIESQPFSEGVLGKYQQSIAYVPTAVGELVLPAIEVKWWDTNANQLKTARLPERTFTVVAGTNNAISTTPQSDAATLPTAEINSNSPSPGENKIWLWVSVGLNVVLLITLVGLWLQRHKQPPLVNVELDRSTTLAESRAFTQLQKAAKEGPKPFRAALNKWLRSLPPSAGIFDLADLVPQLDSEAVADLKELDTLLYRPHEDQRAKSDLPEKLAAKLLIWRNSQRSSWKGEQKESGLAPLYP